MCSHRVAGVAADDGHPTRAGQLAVTFSGMLWPRQALCSTFLLSNVIVSPLSNVSSAPAAPSVWSTATVWVASPPWIVNQDGSQPPGRPVPSSTFTDEMCRLAFVDDAVTSICAGVPKSSIVASAEMLSSAVSDAVDAWPVPVPVMAMYAQALVPTTAAAATEAATTAIFFLRCNALSLRTVDAFRGGTVGLSAAYRAECSYDACVAGSVR
jgi:hypothetical protein